MSADKVRKTAMKVFDLTEDTKENKELLNKVEQWLKFCLEERKTKLVRNDMQNCTSKQTGFTHEIAKSYTLLTKTSSEKEKEILCINYEGKLKCSEPF